MKVSRMHRGSYGKVVAFFDIETEEGFNIKGFKLVEGQDGKFVGFPSQKVEDEYKATVWADKELKQKVNQLALDYYNSAADRQEDQEIPEMPIEEIPF